MILIALSAILGALLTFAAFDYFAEVTNRGVSIDESQAAEEEQEE